MIIINDIKNAFLPELIIVIFILLNIILSFFINKNTYKKARIINIIGILSAIISMAFMQINPTYFSYNNSLLSNTYTIIFKIMILISNLLVILVSSSMLREKRKRTFEYFAIIQSATLASLLLISANDFLTAFVSMELLTMSCYFLTGFRKNHKSKEASLKYLITSASATILFLFGISYLYGIFGNINIEEINEILLTQPINILFITASLLIIVGAIFKLGCIPFSNWIIDVYEGSTYTTCTFISLIPKIAATAFISRLFVYIFQYSPILQIITAFVAFISIIYASIGAIKQTNIKRFYAYSSIIHSGFILLTISVSNVYALSSVLFYIFTYIFINIGVWSASIIYNKEYNTDNIDDYKGLYYKHPYFSIALIICLIALAGLPPTSGFIAKLYIFTAIVRTNTIFLLILLATLLASVISIFIYIKIIKILFNKQQNNINLNHKFNKEKVILYICALITILICIYPDMLIKLSQITAYYI